MFAQRFAAMLSFIGLVASFTAPAGAMISYVSVENRSNRCAWITVYTTDKMLQPWSIEGGANRPKMLKPGEKSHYRLDSVQDVKVRGEVKENAHDCSGGNVADTHDIREDGSSKVHGLNAVLWNRPGGKYQMWF